MTEGLNAKLGNNLQPRRHDINWQRALGFTFFLDEFGAEVSDNIHTGGRFILPIVRENQVQREWV
jgi:hypothetical protein